MAKYVFDNENAIFQKVTHSLGNILWRVAKWFIASASLAIFYYIIASFFINTEEEKRLRNENRMYQRLYNDLDEKVELMGDVIENLKIRDNGIYGQIFHTDAPMADLADNGGLLYKSEDTPGEDIVEYSSNKLETATKSAAEVEKNFKEIFAKLKEKRDSIPPMLSPVKNLTYAQVGASVGEKLNPFYKVKSMHNGLDLIASQGNEVLASGNGVVSQVIHSGKGLGNLLEIDHGNGYRTRYAHLSNISVSKGQKVEAGQKVGNIGISGNSLVPHLHYEILKNGKYVDPVNYLFASLAPKDYANVMFMSVSTEQSLD